MKILFLKGGAKDLVKTEDLRPISEFFEHEGFSVHVPEYVDDQYGGKELEGIYEYARTIAPDYIYAFSRGVMTACQLLRRGLEVKKAAFVSGLYDMRNLQSDRPDLYEYLKNFFDVANVDEIAKRSPVSFAKELPQIPYLLLHSKEDKRVPFKQAEDFASKVSTATLRSFEGDIHVRIEGRDKMALRWFTQ